MTIGKRIPVVLAALLLALPAMAADKLPRPETLGIAAAVAEDLKSLQNTAIPTDVDLKNAYALREGDSGALVLPECKLTDETLQKAGEKPVSVGQLWFHQLAPMAGGKTVDREKLRLVYVYISEGPVTGVQCSLGVQKGADGLELAVYGRDKAPLAKVPLRRVETKQTGPVELELAGPADERTLLVNVLGQYQAKIAISFFQP